MTVFEQLKKDEADRQAYLIDRRKEIEQLKRREDPSRKRMAMLKDKARKAENFLGSPHYRDYEEYLTDVAIECQIRIRELGLSGKPSHKIGDEVRELSVASSVIDRILREPRDLMKMLKK